MTQKEKIAKLEEELRIVCTNPTSIKALLIVSRERSKENLSNAIMYGSPSEQARRGLADKIEPHAEKKA